ncbi:MAG: YdcH family protein [Caulobacteraceae bacterium]
MAMDARIRELDSRHQTLDRQIQEELSHPAADDLRVRELKRKKLRLKEQIEGLRAGMH